MLLPGVRSRIVALHLREHLALTELVVLDYAFLAAHGEQPVAIDDQAMTGSRRWQRRSQFPGVARGQIYVMQVGVVFEGVESSADDMDRAVMRDAADMVARAGQRLAYLPTIGLRIIYLVPANAGALRCWRAGTADQMQAAIEDRRCGRPAGRRRGAIAVHLSVATS